MVEPIRDHENASGDERMKGETSGRFIPNFRFDDQDSLAVFV